MQSGAVDTLVQFAAQNPLLTAAVLLFLIILLASSSSSTSDDEGRRYTVAHLRQASPRRFEELVGEVWEQRGYDAEVLPEGPDDGLDVIAEKRRESVGIQAKRYQADNRVGSPTVRRVHGAAQQHGVDRAVIATSSDFTDPAEDAAESLGIDLVDGHELAEELSTASAPKTTSSTPATTSSTTTSSSASTTASATSGEDSSTVEDSSSNSHGFLYFLIVMPIKFSVAMLKISVFIALLPFKLIAKIVG